jgi:hypothetical protein
MKDDSLSPANKREADMVPIMPVSHVFGGEIGENVRKFNEIFKEYGK